MSNKLPQRKCIRLKDYDYTLDGYYFITICTENKKCIFSKIETNIIYGISTSKLTKEGKIVNEYLKKINDIYTNIELDEYIIMPNHIHIILIINRKEKISISKIIQQFKGRVTKELKKSIW